jgi:hypothetical protein
MTYFKFLVTAWPVASCGFSVFIRRLLFWQYICGQRKLFTGIVAIVVISLIPAAVGLFIAGKTKNGASKDPDGINS